MDIRVLAFKQQRDPSRAGRRSIFRSSHKRQAALTNAELQAAVAPYTSFQFIRNHPIKMKRVVK